MKRKMATIVFFMVLSLVMTLGGCLNGLNEEVKIADQSVKEQALKETVSLYDNGKNFLIIRTRGSYTAAEAMIILQEWLDQHPDKELRIINAQYGLVYYENKKGGK